MFLCGDNRDGQLSKYIQGLHHVKHDMAEGTHTKSKPSLDATGDGADERAAPPLTNASPESRFAGCCGFVMYVCMYMWVFFVCM